MLRYSRNPRAWQQRRAESRPQDQQDYIEFVTRSGGIGAVCNSVCARLFECHTADGKGLRYRLRDPEIAGLDLDINLSLDLNLDSFGWMELTIPVAGPLGHRISTSIFS